MSESTTTDAVAKDDHDCGGEGEEINFSQFQQTLEVDRTYHVAELLEELYGPAPNSSDRASMVIAKFDGRIDFLVKELQDAKNRRRNISNDDPSITSKNSTQSTTSRRSAKSISYSTTKMASGSESSGRSKEKKSSTTGSKKSFASLFKSSSTSKKKKKKTGKKSTKPSFAPAPTGASRSQVKNIDLKRNDGRSSVTTNGGSVEKMVATAVSAEFSDVLNTTGETTCIEIDEDMNS